MYYRNAQASAVVYDVTKAGSFEKAKNWVKELQRQANPNIVIALVGNKIDLLEAEAHAEPQEEVQQNTKDDAHDSDADPGAGADADADADGDAEEEPAPTQREVPRSEAQQYADESGLLFFETSAKTGEGVLEAFTEIAKHIPLDAKAKPNQAPTSSGNARTELVDLQRRAGASGREAAGCSC